MLFIGCSPEVWYVFLCFIDREEESRRRAKQLQKQIVDTRKEKDGEMQQRNEMIAHLKDQLQEMKAKTSMEGT